MKYLSRILPLILALTVAFVPVRAQQNIDGNRLNRDINIMESVLEEMFRVSSSGAGTASSISSFSLHGESIRGTYLPDYGVIFQISVPTGNLTIVNSDDPGERNLVFQYGDSDQEQEVTAENVTDRMVEFLKDYGSTIGQLADDDHVMVIYGGTPQSTNNFNAFFSVSGNRININSEPDLPVISVSAQVSDLAAYRSGDLGEQQLRNRISISESEPNSSDNKDVRVMANIFDTAFEENEEGFEVRGSVDYLALDNFGVLFFFEARYGSGGPIFQIDELDFQFGSDSSQVQAAEELRQRLQKTREEAEQKRAKLRQNAFSAFETFKQDLREYLVDYGRTLRSVENDQYILVSVTLDAPADEIPERIDLQLNKSVLEQMDRGAISREGAINRVSIREY